jgi:hypothetical protein
MRTSLFASAALVLAASAGLSSPALAQTAEPQYRMKENEAQTGTLLKRDAAISSLPYNKPYADLSDEDKRKLRSVYENMGADDEPPFPRRGYKTVFQALAQIQRKMHIDGMIDLGVMIDPEGNASGVKVYQSPDPEVTRVVSTLLMLEQYKPALCHGQPCSQELPFRANFTMHH